MVICAGCNKQIFDQYLLNVLDQSWHAACVQCSDCGLVLSEKCFSRDGKLFCRYDFFRRYGTKCAGCSEGISPNDLVRKARNKVFHLGCFTCMICRKQLITGEELVVFDENKFVCKQDYVSCKTGLLRPEFLMAAGHPAAFGHKAGRRSDGLSDEAFNPSCLANGAGVSSAAAAEQALTVATSSASTAIVTVSASPKEELLSNNNNSTSSVGVPSPNSSEPCDGLDEMDAAKSGRGGGGGGGGGGGVRLGGCIGGGRGGCGPGGIVVVGGMGVVGVSEYKENDMDLNLDDLVDAKASGDEDDAASMDESTQGSAEAGGGDGKGGSGQQAAGSKRRGPRTTIKAKQLETLKAAFAATPKPTRHIREQLAQETGLNMRVIQVWFQNRRSKERRMKQLSAMGARRGFFRNPRRMRALRAGMGPDDMGDSGELLAFSYFEFYNGYSPVYPGEHFFHPSAMGPQPPHFPLPPPVGGGPGPLEPGMHAALSAEGPQFFGHPDFPGQPLPPGMPPVHQYLQPMPADVPSLPQAPQPQPQQPPPATASTAAAASSASPIESW